jgi:protein-tyrosine phosphatase
MKILMVCLGNICRSPLAEGILSAKAKALNLNWEVDSAGTGGWHSGEMPDRRSIEIAQDEWYRYHQSESKKSAVYRF